MGSHHDLYLIICCFGDKHPHIMIVAFEFAIVITFITFTVHGDEGTIVF